MDKYLYTMKCIEYPRHYCHSNIDEAIKKENIVYRCIDNYNNESYFTKLEICRSLIQSKYLQYAVELPKYKFILPSGIPLYTAFNIDCMLDVFSSKFEYKILFPYNEILIKQRNDIFTDSKSDLLLFKAIKNKLLYDYETNLIYVERLLRELDYTLLPWTQSCYLLLQLIKTDNGYVLSRCIDSKDEAIEKGLIVYQNV